MLDDCPRRGADRPPRRPDARAGCRAWAERAIVALVVLCLFHPAIALADCLPRQRAAVPLSLTGGTILVPVMLNDRAASFVLDTGAQRSVVTEAAIARLGLARDPWVGTTMRGVGGVNRYANADTSSFSLGGVALVRRTLSHDTSLTVGVLPQPASPAAPIDGMLGRDYLSAFDLDLDVAARRLVLYQPSGCNGRFLPWAGDYTAVQVSMPAESAMVVPVVLDGVPLRALLDTGASGSLLAAPGIYRLGLDLARLDADPGDQVSGLGSRAVTMRRHRFKALRVGAQTLESPLIWVSPIQLSPIVDMLLGADWLAGRRVWISYTTRQVFVSSM